MNAFECIKLLLKLDDGLITFVKTCSERNHYVSLLKQELLIAVYLCLVFFNELPLAFNILQFAFILLTDCLLTLLERATKLRSILNFFTSCKHLRIHEADLFLKHLLFFLFKKVLSGTRFKGSDSSNFVFFSTFLFFF